MRRFLQGRIALVQALMGSSLPVTYHDLMLILTSVISACAAWRWPGCGFDRKRFVESLIRFSSPSLHLDHISIGAMLELGLIKECQSPWGGLGKEDRVFTGEEIDSGLSEMSDRYPLLDVRELKKASYADTIYRWLRCGYAHTYSGAGNTTHVPPSRRPAQVSYIGRFQTDGTLIRIASFHLDYVIEVVQEQVSSLADKQMNSPGSWWIDSTSTQTPRGCDDSL